MRIESDSFSSNKIYPGKGKLYVRQDNRIFRFVGSKTESLFLQRLNPRKISWTQVYRRMHKKGITEEIAKKRTRRTVKHQRAVVGASWEVIKAKRNQKPEMREAARAQALREAKEKKKQEQSKRKAEKAKVAQAASRGQPKISKQQARGAQAKVSAKKGARKSIEINENISDGNIQPKQGSNISRKVCLGDIVSIRSPDLFRERKIISPTRRSIESFSAKEIKSIRSMILYQDDEILVINKPPGLATQGGIKTYDHVDGLLHALQFDYSEPPRLVHRLDKVSSQCVNAVDTTGALVLGRTRSAAGKLSFMFQNSTMEKMYTAIVTKFLPRDINKKRIDIPICYGGKPPFEKVTCVTDAESPLMEKAKYATTDYQVIAGTDDYALLRLYPQTGRKHQLRVHCASVLGVSLHLFQPSCRDIGKNQTMRTGRGLVLRLFSNHLSTKEKYNFESEKTTEEPKNNETRKATAHRYIQARCNG
ncbi:14261_t:CDS:10 [Dentiscutata erythropus]|uniref:14261_t:CDS:1 n=1 Tax=Dentiscutata erythropus TaxID=1348616 RepID=A0A9N8Z5R0_9GLOM|nr:14261_t:CDS:10 [Dentiscutata erythropus]